MRREERREEERRGGEESQSRSSRENRQRCRTRCEGLRCKSAHHPHQHSQTERDTHTHTHTLRASPLYHQQPSATASAWLLRDARRGAAGLSLCFLRTLSAPDPAQTWCPWTANSIISPCIPAYLSTSTQLCTRARRRSGEHVCRLHR